MSISGSMEPPRKAPKLSLTEAADVVNEQHSNLETVHQTSSSDFAAQSANEAGGSVATDDDDFSQEEEEENTQIQASLPLYFDHLFGICIGHSQSQIHSSFHRGPISESSQAILPQCSFGFSWTDMDTRILDSQGFIFNSSVASKSPLSTPPPSSSSSPTQQTAQLLPCRQPSIAGSSNATVFKLVSSSSSSSSQSPAAIIFSSPSSTSSSPGSTRSNRSGTPVLFPSPSSSVHSCSPEKAVPRISDAQVRQELLVASNKSVTPSKVYPHQQEVVKGKVFLSQSLRKHLTCTQGSHSHQIKSCRKRKLDFEVVANCSDVGNRPTYICPPSCTPLSDCAQVNSRASIFAVVLQGKDSLILCLWLQCT